MATTKQSEIDNHPTMKQSDIDDHQTIKQSRLGSITGIHPFSLVRASLVLAFLITAIVAAKLVNGYLICDLTLTTCYLDLAIGVALVIACGIIPLLAMGINRDAKTKGASCCSRFAIVAVFTLLSGIFVFAFVAAVLNFVVAVPTSWSPFGIDLQRESQLEAVQLQQRSSRDAARQIFDFCASNKTEGNPDILALARFGRNEWWNWTSIDLDRSLANDIPRDRCEVANFFWWTTRDAYTLCRLDPFNVCSANDNDAINALFRSDPATFRLIQRADVIFKALVGLLWLVPAAWTLVAIFAFNPKTSGPPESKRRLG